MCVHAFQETFKHLKFSESLKEYEMASTVYRLTTISPEKDEKNFGRLRCILAQVCNTQQLWKRLTNL